MIPINIAEQIGGLNERLVSLEKEVASLKESTIQLTRIVGNDVGLLYERIDSLARACEKSEPALPVVKTDANSEPTGDALVGKYIIVHEDFACFKDNKVIILSFDKKRNLYHVKGNHAYADLLRADFTLCEPTHIPPCAGWINSHNRKLDLPKDPYARQRELLGKWIITNDNKLVMLNLTRGLVIAADRDTLDIRTPCRIYGVPLNSCKIDPNQNP